MSPATPADLPGEPVDVLVIGGGVHGAGVLQAAAAAGRSALLLEERELASGTSSRSSKLIHGGLRYLETARFGLVRESLRERAILLRVAPHLVRLVPFHVPVYRTTRRRPWQLRAGLCLYSLLGGLSSDTRFTTVPRRDWDSLDGLRTDGLQAVFRYRDGQTDDAALVRAVVRSAESLGARLLQPARFLGARRVGPLWHSRVLSDASDLTLVSRTLVNAAGPWAMHVQSLVDGAPPPPAMDLVAGAHVELPGTLSHGIYYCEAPIDARAVFSMPWRGHTLVGTTETPFTGDPRNVSPLRAELDYLLATFSHHFPSHPTSVLASWSGLRVLPRAASKAFTRPRDITWSQDHPTHPTYLALYGGKLTGYRAIAAKALARIAPSLPPPSPRADTASLPLPRE